MDYEYAVCYYDSDGNESERHFDLIDEAGSRARITTMTRPPEQGTQHNEI